MYCHHITRTGLSQNALQQLHARGQSKVQTLRLSVYQQRVISKVLCNVRAGRSKTLHTKDTETAVSLAWALMLSHTDAESARTKANQWQPTPPVAVVHGHLATLQRPTHRLSTSYEIKNESRPFLVRPILVTQYPFPSMQHSCRRFGIFSQCLFMLLWVAFLPRKLLIH